jgi:hypothetical protein
MLNRLVNALATRVAAQLQPFVAAAVAEQRAADQKQVRELVAEMEDVLEKFSRVVAREGMRRSREAKRLLEEQTIAAAAAPAAAAAAPAQLTAAERKSLLRQRLAAGGGRPHVVSE